MELYKYLPLPEGCIRLATIQQGNLQDEMVVHMTIADFDDDSIADIDDISMADIDDNSMEDIDDNSMADFSEDNVPEYEALSYVWGSEDDSESVWVRDDEGQGQRFHHRVTKNLAIALRHLRNYNSPRVMWIDALCIDQSNRTEKSHQVKKMHAIYEKAKRVVAFLGPEENDSNYGMNLIRHIASQVKVDLKSSVMKPADGADPRFGDESEELPLMPEDRDAIYYILCRTWFERLWIRQEIFLANKEESLIQCGFEEIKWPVFRQTLACLALNPNLSLDDSDNFVARIKFLGGFIRQEKRVSFLNHHEDFGNATCKDSRDQVFAVRALLRPLERDICPTPDYDKPWVETYKDLVLSYVEEFLSLGILRECHYDPTAPTPSWVPDWSTPTTATSLRRCTLMASSELGAYCEEQEDGVLRVAGVISTTISDLQAIPDLDDISNRERYEVYRQILTNRIYEQEDLSPEAYARTFVCGRIASPTSNTKREVPTSSTPIDTSISLEAATRIVTLINNHSQYDDDVGAKFEENSDGENFFSSSLIIGGFQFARCDGHYIGIVPSAAQVGDKICVLMGCDSPMVLRPTENGKFLLIGETYVDGLCEGQAFLGPLKDGTRISRISWDGDLEGSTFVFSDTSTHRDSRLEQLPMNLSAVRKQADDNNEFRLRVCPEILRQKCVDIRYLDLV
ncbi:HET-domain-containing protein [Hypoxylon rubiginosum]|uniref:HET-domain-containing protein n=1 Tax=Hypoxylon rubiginosum TaxID=110542 RepID=A0ACC0D170_9PEZI|nr:HET-domain-containing protein [Hypoxylon rubiginosum]